MDPTQAIRETNLVLQLKEEIKSKTEISWSSRKKKERIFNVYFVSTKFFSTFVFYFSVYGIE